MMLVVAVLGKKGRGLRHREKGTKKGVVDLYSILAWRLWSMWGVPY